MNIMPNNQNIILEFTYEGEVIRLPVVGFVATHLDSPRPGSTEKGFENVRMEPLVLSPNDGEVMPVFTLLSRDPYKKVDGKSVKFVQW